MPPVRKSAVSALASCQAHGWAQRPKVPAALQVDGMQMILRGVVAVFVLCSALLFLVTLGTRKSNIDYELVQSLDDSVPLQKNSQFQFQVPLSQLDETKVGDVIQGQVPIGGSNGGQVAFTGQVTSGRGISSSTGSLTVTRPVFAISKNKRAN